MRPPAEDVDDTSVPGETGVQDDLDGDGWSVLDGDCDDANAAVHPLALERCDGIDNDCDGLAENDVDGDGWFDCEDCDDADANVWPGASDPLDGVDTDCDGTDGVALHSDEVLLGSVGCGELGLSMVAVDTDSDSTDEVLVGGPRRETCANGTLGQVVLAGPGQVHDQIDKGVRELAGWRVDAYEVSKGGARAAVLYFGWSPGGVVEVFPIEARVFDELPALRIAGTIEDPLGEVAAVGQPMQWLAVTAIASASHGPTYVGLFPPEASGDLAIDEASEVIASSNQHFATGQWIEDLGDRDGDGLHELGVGARYGDGSDPLDRAYVVTPGIDSVLEDGLETWWGSEVGGATGASFRGGDLDGDGSAEIAISSHYAEGGRGAVHIVGWLGPGDHQVVNEAFAQVVGELEGDYTRDSALADADGDGVGDLVVGAQQELGGPLPGKAMLFLGPVQGTLTRADADRVWVGDQPGARFGYELATGDFDGNGVLDLAVSAPNQDDGDLEDVGAVHFVFDYGL